MDGLLFDIDTFAIHDGPGIRLAAYLKGCPLSCQWCHSPESQHAKPQLILVRERCTFCSTCQNVCPHSLHQVSNHSHLVSRTDCHTCGLCVDACPYNALAIKGYQISAAALVEKAVRMKPFFKHSNGGITLTGGEVTMQAAFAQTVLMECRKHGIHTAMETCGFCTWEQLETLLPYTDLLLYDIKLIDDKQHTQWTGVSNQLILHNASRLSLYPVVIRIPLIPGITDTEQNLRGIFSFMNDAGLSSVELLPYNPASAAKYEWLDLPYLIQGESQTQEQLDSFLKMAHQTGLQARIV